MKLQCGRHLFIVGMAGQRLIFQCQSLWHHRLGVVGSLKSAPVNAHAAQSSNELRSDGHGE